MTAGAAQGYFGGWVDLVFQRIEEIWSSTPSLYVIMIVSAIITPNFWTLLLLLVAMLSVAWFWHDSLGARESANRAALDTCSRTGASLLDGTVAFSRLHDIVNPASDAPGAMAAAFHHGRTAKMAAYALCGFANFGSVGIQIGGITPLAPEVKKDIARLAVRAMLGGAFASWMTATIAGAFLD